MGNNLGQTKGSHLGSSLPHPEPRNSSIAKQRSAIPERLNQICHVVSPCARQRESEVRADGKLTVYTQQTAFQSERRRSREEKEVMGGKEGGRRGGGWEL